MDAVWFDDLLRKLFRMPGLYVNRDRYLRAQFQNTRYAKKIHRILEVGPVKAGVKLSEIEKLVRDSVNKEAVLTSTVSFAAGIPGGAIGWAAIAPDLLQFYFHILIIMQKILYMYGYPDIQDIELDVSDSIQYQMLLFLGVMSGAPIAGQAAAELLEQVLSKSTGKIIVKTVAGKVAAKGAYYVIERQLTKEFGKQVTKMVGKGAVAKAVPLVGGVVSGGLSLAFFYPMCHRLEKYMQEAVKNM